MGTDRSRDEYEGFLLLDPHMPSAIWAAESTYDEDSAQAGPITPDSGVSTEVLIVSSGTPEDGDPLLLRGQKAGMPGVDRAWFVHRETAGQTWLGWDVVSSVSGFEMVDTIGVASGGYPHPHPVDLQDGRILIVADDTGAAGQQQVGRRIRATDGTYAARAIVYTEDTTANADRLHPRAIRLPSGRILCFHLTFDVEQETAQVSMLYTDSPADTTWSTGAIGVLPSPINMADGATGSAIDSLRVAYDETSGQMCLLVLIRDIDAATETIGQYASNDLGASFTQVGSDFATGATSGAAVDGCDIVSVSGFFVVSFKTTNNTLGAFRRVGSAYDPIDSAVDIIDGNAEWRVKHDGSGISLVVADDETIFAYGGPQTISPKTVTSPNFAISTDAGASWTYTSTRSRYWQGGGNLATNISGAWYRGRIFMCGNQSAPAANINAITASWLGGYTDVTLPPDQKNASRIMDQMWWTDAWVGHDDPDNHFSTAHTGIPTNTRGSDGSWSIVTDAGDTATFEDDETAEAVYVEIVARWHVQRNSGTVSLLVQCGQSAGTAHTEVVIQLDADLKMIDNNGGATLATAAGQGANELDILVALNGQSCTCWYRTIDAADPARRWTKLHTTAVMGIAASTQSNRFQVVSEVSTDFDWWELHYFRQNERTIAGFNLNTIGRDISDDQTSPDDLFGRNLPASGTTYVNDGVSIRGKDGPMLIGDTFSLEITHPSPAEDMLPTVQRSPRKYWLSDTVTADDSVAVQLFSQATEDVDLGNDSIGLYLGGGVLVEALKWQGKIAGGAWTDIADITRYTTIGFTRRGATIVPSSSGGHAASQYYQRDELAGGYFIFPSNKARTIVGNTEGNWGTGSPLPNEKRPTIYLDATEMDGTESASSAGRLVFPATLTIAHQAGSRAYQGYRLLLHPAALGSFTSPPGGKYKIPIFHAGPLVIFGKAQDREYSVTREAQVESIRLPDGTEPTRVVAPSQRTVTINFNDSSDVSSARGSDDPDYLVGTTEAGAEAIGHRFDLPLMLDGLLAELDGAHRPIVYLPRIPKSDGGSSDVQTFRAERAAGAIYGRIISVVTQDLFLGSPMVSEQIRGPQIVIQEEV